LKNFEARYGTAFCLVVSRSDDDDDAYVIPVGAARQLFREDDLDPDGNGWSATIARGVMTHRGRQIAVSRYFNAFHLLGESSSIDVEVQPDVQVIEGDAQAVSVDELSRLVQDFNEKYRTAAPLRRATLSEEIARPGFIADYVKQLRSHTCQFCQEVGFRQRNGDRYAEAHHIVELHDLVPGSYCSDNIIVVCATCHRKLHYAHVAFACDDGRHVVVLINDKPYGFERNLITR
jgi:predicted restriction endonuclease